MRIDAAAADAATLEAQTVQPPAHAASSCLKDNHDTAATAAAAASTTQTPACSPRPAPPIARRKRPADIKVLRSNGMTTVSTADLKQRISETNTSNCSTKLQTPRPKACRPHSKTLVLMGNRPSSLSAISDDDDDSDSSLRAAVRNPVRILRKSSTNLFKRMDSKLHLPMDMSGTVIHVQEQQTLSQQSTVVADERPVTRHGSPVKRMSNPPVEQARLSSSAESLPMNETSHAHIHSASTITITESGASQPLSATETIRNLSPEKFSPSKAQRRKSLSATISDSRPTSSSRHRHSALSPTIPAPSPLPEDSPHQYGLRDRMETPDKRELETPMARPRRCSSGVEIFTVRKHPNCCKANHDRIETPC
jgi:hypothetical protein